MARDFHVLGSALAAPARSAMLDLLMDGSTRPAAELADVAGVRPATASEHLAVLTAAGLVAVEPRGRQRRYRLAGTRVAAALEQLGTLSPSTEVRSLRHSREQRDLGRARLCYDHLAGRLGVALTDGLVAAGWLTADELHPTRDGRDAVDDLDLPPGGSARRPRTLSCPDWTERRPHLAGALGAQLAAEALRRGWVRRRASGRGLDVGDGVVAGVADAWGVALVLDG